jgi:hypothetical protein
MQNEGAERTSVSRRREPAGQEFARKDGAAGEALGIEVDDQMVDRFENMSEVDAAGTLRHLAAFHLVSEALDAAIR